MKYLIVRCEDLAPTGGRAKGLLESAKTSHLLHLAQAGAAGVVRIQGSRLTIDRLHLHGALLGLRPHEPEAAVGRWYAADVNLRLTDGETAWCCDLVTHQDGRIVDPTAGKIPTTESRVLIQALNEQLGSEGRRWEVGDGSHHILVVRGTTLGGDGCLAIPPPESVVGQVWRRALPKGSPGGGLRLLIEQASKVLEDHPVNRVRMDLGENPANLVWLWGSAHADPGRSFADRTGLSGAVVSHSFPMRGLAQSLGLDWKERPRDLEENSLRRLLKVVTELIHRHDLVYLHLQIESASPVERLCAMERIDQRILKPLTGTLSELGSWRLAALVDNRTNGWVPFVAMGTGLPQRPAVRLVVKQLIERGLVFEEGPALFSWFTKGESS